MGTEVAINVPHHIHLFPLLSLSFSLRTKSHDLLVVACKDPKISLFMQTVLFHPKNCEDQTISQLETKNVGSTATVSHCHCFMRCVYCGKLHHQSLLPVKNYLSSRVRSRDIETGLCDGEREKFMRSHKTSNNGSAVKFPRLFLSLFSTTHLLFISPPHPSFCSHSFKKEFKPLWPSLPCRLLFLFEPLLTSRGFLKYTTSLRMSTTCPTKETLSIYTRLLL